VPAAKLTGATLTTKLDGVVELAAENCSQLPPLVVDAVTEYVALELLDVETAMLCPGGAVAPAVSLNVKVVGSAISDGSALTVR
jgi:hypothetical protein